METFKFTKTKLESLPPAERGQVEYGDTIVNGLRIRIGTSGVKSFCISRKRNGKFIRATLGRFPDLTIDNARAKCSGQLKLATALEFFQYRFSDSFGGNPPLYSCGLSAL